MSRRSDCFMRSTLRVSSRAALVAVWAACGAAAASAQPSLNVGSASGAPKGRVAIAVTLANGSGQVAATSNDIVFDSTQVTIALKANGTPDCTIGSAIGADSAASKSLVASLPRSRANAKILRVGVIGTDNANAIPDGTLFTCRFVIASGVKPGPKVLRNTPGASDATANPVVVQGTDGRITVTGAPRRRHR